jgi:hypothetical protein
MIIPEEAQLTAKRVCPERAAPPTMATSPQDDSVYTLSADTGTSLSSVYSLASPEQPSFDRQEWIRSRRPSDPSLYCYDYRKAEAEAGVGTPGNPE